MQTWLSRSGSVLLGIGGVLFGMLEVLVDLFTNQKASLSQQVSAPIHTGEGLQMIALFVLALGLIGVYVRRPAGGALRAVGFVLALAGTILAFALDWSGTVLLPYLAETAPKVVDGLITTSSVQIQVGIFGSNTVFGLGWILFAVAQVVTADGARLAWVILSRCSSVWAPAVRRNWRDVRPSPCSTAFT